ncbi:hypothetical protein [Mesorhizobium sp.]|uniref:hypothetical protein n=1 Tax=Mesorhizobium sp. TaxID=1871066 RepID=UPI0025FBE175|nr:hypothetical protein [Mesorhizobium sp.]
MIELNPVMADPRPGQLRLVQSLAVLDEATGIAPPLKNFRFIRPDRYLIPFRVVPEG